MARFWLLGFISFMMIGAGATTAQTDSDIRLAYVQNNVVTLADEAGTPITSPGPQLGPWQSAVLFWSPNGDTLYIATRDGLFSTSATGGASVRLPGDFGLTVTIARHGGVLYNLDVENPQEVGAGKLGFPLRETNIANMSGGRGRYVSTIGNFEVGTANAVLRHAAAVYGRDAGLLEGGRPRIYPTYGNSVLYTCCFPNAGLSLVNTGNGQIFDYDFTFITGASALNATQSRLAAPTTDDIIRIYDLISQGSRDYNVEIQGGLGRIERVGWALDDSALFFISRQSPANPLELLPEVTYPVDTRSADLVLWRLNLINGDLDRLESLGDGYGVSSLAVTDNFVYMTLVESNTALVQALNNGTLSPTIQAGDPALDVYVPRSILWRYNLRDGSLFALAEGIWGVTARPY